MKRWTWVVLLAGLVLSAGVSGTAAETVDPVHPVDPPKTLALHTEEEAELEVITCRAMECCLLGKTGSDFWCFRIT